MKLLGKLLLSFVANGIALIAAAYFIPGVSLSADPKNFLILTAILTVANVVIRPIIKLVLSPLIAITFGLFILVINAAILFAVDFYVPAITIEGLVPLLIATIVVTAANWILRASSKIAA